MSINNLIFQKILKHKRIILASVLPFVFWGALLALWFYRAPQSIGSSDIYISNIGGQISISDLAESENVLDNDSDGLSNWEESIYGTDSNNTDTDGDGYLDGEEVLSGHNPALKGPNDALEKNSGPLTKEEQNRKTATSAFAKLALENFLKSGKSIQGMSPEELDRQLKDAFKNDPQATKDYQSQMRDVLSDYIPEDLDKKIKKSDKDGEQSIQEYKQNFDKAVTKSQKEFNSKPLHQIITDAFEKKDFRNIDTAIAYYDTLYKNFLEISAPKSLFLAHRSALLLFYETARSLEAIKEWENDSVKAIVALKKLTAWTDKLDKQTQTAPKSK